MKTCAFCNEKIKLTLDYCSFCGSCKETTHDEDSKMVQLEHYFKALKNEDIHSDSLSDYGFDIKNWQLPFWIEFGKKTSLKMSILDFIKKSYMLIIVLVLTVAGFAVVNKPGLVVSTVIALIVVVVKHNNFFVEALKFENPHNKPEHYIRYNLNNTKGGVGIEEFILNEKEFNQIRFYFNNSNLTMINFGSTDDTLTWVNDYSEKELLERFVML